MKNYFWTVLFLVAGCVSYQTMNERMVMMSTYQLDLSQSYQQWKRVVKEPEMTVLAKGTADKNIVLTIAYYAKNFLKASDAIENFKDLHTNVLMSDISETSRVQMLSLKAEDDKIANMLCSKITTLAEDRGYKNYKMSGVSYACLHPTKKGMIDIRYSIRSPYDARSEANKEASSLFKTLRVF